MIRALFKLIARCFKMIFTFALIFCVLLAYSYFIEPNMLVKTEKTLSNTGHIAKIVFFSDTHFGEFYNISKSTKIVEKINSQNPDIVIFGGDLIDKYNQDKPDTQHISREFSKITGEKYAIWGNHDYGGGAHRIYEKTMEDAGFLVLKNQNNYLKNFDINIIGLDDYLFGNPILKGFKKDSLNIIAMHEPDTIDKFSEELNSIAFAGHSHGGQVMLPFLTKLILPPGSKNYVRGEYTLKDETKLFVSRGIGMTKLPIRFGSVPEIFVLNIES